MKSDSKTIEEKMQQLDELIAWFGSDTFTLDEAFAKHEEAEKLATEIEKQLDTMTNKVTVLKKKFDT